MTPTPEALADAARVLRGLSVARSLLTSMRQNDFEGFTLSGNAATMDDNERAVIAEYDEAIAATAGDDTALSAVAAWLEMQNQSVKLIQAARNWAGDCEGQPRDPSDAQLLKAILSYEGDQTEPCDECDGDCGEPCAPYTVKAMHRMLDNFCEKWRRDHGLQPLPAATPPEPTDAP